METRVEGGAAEKTSEGGLGEAVNDMPDYICAVILHTYKGSSYTEEHKLQKTLCKGKSSNLHNILQVAGYDFPCPVWGYLYANVPCGQCSRPTVASSHPCHVEQIVVPTVTRSGAYPLATQGLQPHAGSFRSWERIRMHQ